MQICTRDFRETQALKALFSAPSEAAGITDVVHKNYGAKLTGLNLKAIKLSAGFEIKDEMNIAASPLRVLNADDDVADVILSNIGPSCKKIISGHLKQRRTVFVAGKAIQAKNFEVSVNVGPKADASFTCSIPIICSNDTGLSGNVDYQRQRKRGAVEHVTFALVPAEIGGARRELVDSDLK